MAEVSHPVIEQEQRVLAFYLAKYLFPELWSDYSSEINNRLMHKALGPLKSALEEYDADRNDRLFNK